MQGDDEKFSAQSRSLSFDQILEMGENRQHYSISSYKYSHTDEFIFTQRQKQTYFCIFTCSLFMCSLDIWSTSHVVSKKRTSPPPYFEPWQKIMGSSSSGQWFEQTQDWDPARRCGHLAHSFRGGTLDNDDDEIFHATNKPIS